MLKKLFLIALLLWGVHSWWISRPITHRDGVLAPNIPEQITLDEVHPFDFKGYRITPLAKYIIEARVLSRENYYMGREADLSATDFMLGWQRMSDESVLRNIEFRQSGRFGYWQVKEFPIPQREIETSASNVHLIAADKRIAARLSNVRRGQVVRMRGYLVRADASDGWQWTSSLSREDTGAGACELFWVEDLY